MYRYTLAAMTFLILFKALSADPVKAATEPTQQEMHMRIEQHFRQQAEHFGIETEGKELKQVRKELHDAQEAKRLEMIQRAAARYDIETEGMSMHKIVEGIRTAREKEVHDLAKKLGIQTEGKTIQQLTIEVEEKQEAAK